MDNKDNESSDKSKLKNKPNKSVKKKLAKNNEEKYGNIESRIEKSTNEWVARKLSDAKLVNTTSGKNTANTNSKPFSKSFSTDRLLSCSTPHSKSSDDCFLGNLHKTNEKSSSSVATAIDKSRSRRKSIFKFNFCENKEQHQTQQSSSSSSSVCGTDVEAKNKEYEELIIRARYAQSNFMRYNVKHMSAKLDEQAMIEISNTWQSSNELREQLCESKAETSVIRMKSDAINAFECLRDFLAKYIAIRDRTDPLYVGFAQLINQQKLLIKLESEEEVDEQKSIEQLEKSAQILSEMTAQLALFDGLVEVSVDLLNVSDIKRDIIAIKRKFAERAQQFEKLIDKRNNYQKTKDAFC